MSGQRILVTGATGYIGSRLVKGLACEYPLRLFARSLPAGHVDSVVGDVRNLSDVSRAVEGCDAVLHLAGAVPSPGRPDREFYEINVLGTLNVLLAAQRHRVRKVVYASSVTAVGPDHASLPVREDAPCRPSMGAYGQSKCLAEAACASVSAASDVRTIILRLATVVPKRSVRRPEVHDGHLWFAYVHVEDAIQAFNLAIRNDTIQFGIFHIAAAHPQGRYDTAKAMTVLGFRPGHDFEDGGDAWSRAEAW